MTSQIVTQVGHRLHSGDSGWLCGGHNDNGNYCCKAVQKLWPTPSISRQHSPADWWPATETEVTQMGDLPEGLGEVQPSQLQQVYLALPEDPQPTKHQLLCKGSCREQKPHP